MFNLSFLLFFYFSSSFDWSTVTVFLHFHFCIFFLLYIFFCYHFISIVCFRFEFFIFFHQSVFVLFSIFFHALSVVVVLLNLIAHKSTIYVRCFVKRNTIFLAEDISPKTSILGFFFFNWVSLRIFVVFRLFFFLVCFVTEGQTDRQQQDIVIHAESRFFIHFFIIVFQDFIGVFI